MHHYQDLITIFNSCFEADFNTKLVKGEEEPIYLPANESRPHHEICFAHGYFSSALHECAHWFIAGEARRKLVDFGYWYEPDGRDAKTQALFLQVEVKPQALEWILSKASKHPFRVSLDNLNGEESDVASFKQAVYEQVKIYCAKGLHPRAERFRKALCAFYKTKSLLQAQDFSLEEL